MLPIFVFKKAGLPSLWRVYALAVAGVHALMLATSVAEPGVIIGIRGEKWPATHAPDPGDEEACLQALRQYQDQSDPEQVAALKSFLTGHPNSPYRLGMLTALGGAYFHTCRFSAALETFEQAWKIGSGPIDPKAEPLAGRAAGELALMYARLGRFESLQALLHQVEGKEYGGDAASLLADARLGLGLMDKSPQTSFRCGPLALSRILSSQKVADFAPPPIRNSASTRQGFSLKQTCDIAHQAGMTGYRMAKRSPGAVILTPAVVHWKAGHYAALLKPRASGRYPVEDPTFAVRMPVAISAAALDEEASGYFLVDVESLPEGWTAVSDAEGAQVFGKGATGSPTPDGTHSNSPTIEPDPRRRQCSKGMASWAIQSAVVGLNITDTPLGYRPPVGDPVGIKMTYNSREATQNLPQPITNTGGRWMRSTVAYLSYLEEAGINVYPGTGARNYYKWDEETHAWLRDMRTYSTVQRLPDGTFQVSYPDGSVELYAYAAWGWNAPVSLEFFRTSRKDPAGNETRYEYERVQPQGVAGEYTRLKTIIDAVGGQTVFQYAGNNLDPMRVTDPSGRFAEFEYDNQLRLVLIRDVLGLTSQFRYQGLTDQITGLITPYGETGFESGDVGSVRFMQVTHPNGDLERVEFRHLMEGMPQVLESFPVGLNVYPNYNNYRNVLYWDRKAMREAPGELASAQITHFAHTPDVSVSSDLIESSAHPLEGRIFYNYRNQSSGAAFAPATDTRMTRMGRLLDDGSSQVYQFDFNDLGNTTLNVDPAGRTTSYVYASNMIDLVQVRQTRGTEQDVLQTNTYNAQHKLLTSTDGGGNTTTYTYNSRAQVLTATDALGHLTTFTYDATGHLLTADGPLPGTSDKGTFGYDAAHRLTSLTEGSGQQLTFEYDALDRITKKTYPNGDFEQWTYENLELKTHRDASGGITTCKYNTFSQLVEVVNRANGKTLLDWCRCGGLKTYVDPLGKTTRFTFDVAGRKTGRINPDGTTLQYAYGPLSGRLAKITDELGRELSYAYNVDNTLSVLALGGIAQATPPLNYSWDSSYPRVTQMTQGAETASFSYVSAEPGNKFVGNLDGVDGPLANDSISYGYDALGNIISLGVNGDFRTTQFDEVCRPTTLGGALGAATLGYQDASCRLASETLSNGQTTQCLYGTGTDLRLLTEIAHRNAASQLISRFGFSYNADSHITSLVRQTGAAAALTDTPGYDAQARLTSYQKTLAGGGSQTFSYSYDGSDNRLSETIDGVTRTETADLMNALVAAQPGAAPARSYEWDSAGRLAAVVQGTHRSEFSYNLLGQRSRIVEKENNTLVVDRRFVWSGVTLLEERSAANAVVKRFFPHGFTTAAGKFFYTRDHLGSIREVTDETGAVRARYDYDPYGRRTKLSGDMEADFGFTGHFHHAESGLALTFGRPYDASLGRWISRDPSGLSAGPNLYCYAGNNPLNRIDPLGMDFVTPDTFQNSLDLLIQDSTATAAETTLEVATNPATVTGVAAIGVTAVALPAAAPLAAAAGVVSIGLSGYGVAVNVYNDVGKHIGCHTSLTGGAITDGTTLVLGENRMTTGVTMITAGCDTLLQFTVGLGMGAAVKQTIAGGWLTPNAVKLTEELGAAAGLKQNADAFLPDLKPRGEGFEKALP